MDVFLNGRMVPADQANLHVSDAGLQHGVGLFETMQCFEGEVFRLHEHLDRLQRSARELGLASQLKTDAMADAVEMLVRHNALVSARIRLTLTAGPISLLSAGNTPDPQPTLLIVSSPATTYDPAYYEKGIRVLIAPPAANPFDATSGHKTLNYWQRLRTLRQAAAAGAGEAIWLNISNHLASGAISNLFLVQDGKLLTPIAHGEEDPAALHAPVLPGITRQAVLEIAEDLEMDIEKRMLSVEELLQADEVFLTNSSWLVLPVTRVEQATIGKGEPGPLTQRIHQEIRGLIRRECSGQASTDPED